jgi:hypothetical protein
LRREVRAALVAVAVAASACTGDGPPRPAPTPLPASLTGRLLLTTGVNEQELAVYTLPHGPTRSLRLPTLGQYEFWNGGVWGRGSRTESAFIMAGAERAQLYRVSPGRAPAKVGPPIRGDGSLVAVTDRYAIATSCSLRTSGFFGTIIGRNQGAILRLDLDHPKAWTVVGAGCGGQIAPDGRTLFYAGRDTGDSVVFQATLGSQEPPRPVVDLRALPALRTAGIDRPAILFMAVGGPGVAVMVGNGFDSPDRFALIVKAGDRPAKVMLLGAAYPNAAAWQPGGSLLMFMDCVHCFGFRAQVKDADIRIYDPRTETLTQIVAGAPDFEIGAVWAPDGSLLAMNRTRAGLTVVDRHGRPIRTIPVQGRPIAWGS